MTLLPANQITLSSRRLCYTTEQTFATP